jgi:two-component system sensor kinase FixL
MLPLAALAAVWVRRSHSVLDLWLVVVLCAWLMDIALGMIISGGRFDLGFYVSRLFGVVAGSFVLIVLMTDTVMLYARAAKTYEAELTARQKRLEEIELELLRVTRLSEFGHMASGLGHEVGQPLTAAGSYLSAAVRMMDTGHTPKVRPILEKAAQQVSRAGAVFSHIRKILKKGETDQRAEVLSEIIDEAVALALTGEKGRGVKFRKHLDPRVSLALIDRVQVEQVIINLIRNALQAMAGSARREIEITTKLAADKAIEIAVSDTGLGLDPEIRDRLFEPFVTSKSDGIGLGLSISRSIVEAHGGRISVEDNPGGGTTFRFTLPSLEPGYSATV